MLLSCSVVLQCPLTPKYMKFPSSQKIHFQAIEKNIQDAQVIKDGLTDFLQILFIGFGIN